MKGPLASKSQVLEIYRLNSLGQLINPKYLEQNKTGGGAEAKFKLCKLQMDFILLLCPQLKCTFIFVVDLQLRRVFHAPAAPAFNRPAAD